MNFDIVPYLRAGRVRLGMSPEQVRQAIGSPVESFHRWPDSAHPCDAFYNRTVFAYYSAAREAEAFEFTLPARIALNGLDFAPNWSG